MKAYKIIQGILYFIHFEKLSDKKLLYSLSEVNIGEANMIVSLAEILLNSECQSLTIAVLTPYHKQREQLNILLKKK